MNSSCVDDAWPPIAKDKIEDVVLNLDDAPIDRWRSIAAPMSNDIASLINEFKHYLEEWSKYFKEIVVLLEWDLSIFVDKLPEPFRSEMIGISDATNIELGDIVLFNIMYEATALCTSIVAKTKDNEIIHARNLDFGIFMGWDVRNHTWSIEEKLKPLLRNVKFVKNGKVFYEMVSYVGYVGALTIMKNDIFSLTVNSRFDKFSESGMKGIIQWMMGDHSAMWNTLLSRQLAEMDLNYTEVKHKLATDKIVAPIYYTISGSNAKEGAVITRWPEEGHSDIVDIGTANYSSSFLLQTNYDHWKKPLFIDDRRTPGIFCMKQSGDTFNNSSLYNVLSTIPVLNKLSTYTVIMSAQTNQLISYKRKCPDPCYPW
ncbi:hypothetical protein SNEBB_003485 [Seison nebaliae]|nr:hypothetical protein SNEBB_003485 [Seison nebaliae]